MVWKGQGVLQETQAFRGPKVHLVLMDDEALRFVVASYDLNGNEAVKRFFRLRFVLS